MSRKDRNGMRSALRRAFSRSDLYREAQNKNRIEHYDHKRPRCFKWSWCNVCGEVVPSWKTQLDHIIPVIPLDRTFDDMTMQEYVDRLWCSIDNLQTICLDCHDRKCKEEMKLRPSRKRLTKKRKPGIVFRRRRSHVNRCKSSPRTVKTNSKRITSRALHERRAQSHRLKPKRSD